MTPPLIVRTQQGLNSETFKAQQRAFLTGQNIGFPTNQAGVSKHVALCNERGIRHPASINVGRTRATDSRSTAIFNNPQGYYSGATSYRNQPAFYQGATSYSSPHTSFGDPRTYNRHWPQTQYSVCRPQRNQWCSEEAFENISLDFQNLSLKSDREKEILNILQRLGQGQFLSARDIAHKLHIQKKEANHYIYKLKEEGKLQKIGDSPPGWCIAVSSPRQSREIYSDIRGQNSKISTEAGSSQYRGKSKKHYPETLTTFHQVQKTTEVRNQSESTYEESSTDEGSSSVKSEELDSPTMVVNKEQICEYLFGVEQSTAVNIAKNIGLTKAKDVNITLYQLEKQGDICREATTPPKWSLTEKKRDRMQLKRKAHEVLVAESVNEVEDLDASSDAFADEESENVGSAFGSDDMNGGEKVVKAEALNDYALDLDGSSGEPPKKRMKDETLNGSFATDDVTEFGDMVGTPLNFAEPPVERMPPLEKLLQCIEKNPVSGLLEYTQFLNQKCDFILLQQTGPSHDPRFKIQAVIDGRQFPAVVAASKKLARKDAAACTLKILLREARGEEETKESPPPETEKATVKTPPQTLPSLAPGKNPVSILMETAQKMGETCVFQFLSHDGPAHDPRFTFSVILGEKTFPAVTANSKKLAKQRAAEVAVKKLSEEGKLIVSEKMTEPKPQSENNSSTEVASDVPTLTPEELNAAKSAHVGDLIKYLNANPISGLLEYSRANGFAAEFKLVDQSGPPHDPKFVFQAKVGGRWFPAVSAHSKKQAKQEAADAALRVLIGDAEKAERTGELPPQLPVSGSTFHDHIAMLSHQCFNFLTARVQHSLLGRKILAAIIMRHSEEDTGTVISIGTGNRCVKGEELSLKGETVNDCHAEVISRRGFIRFLYSELMKHDPESSEAIFEEAEGGKLKIKDHITFHLYISTAPCGDGALFDKSCSDPPAEEGNTTHHPLFENPKQGKLRTKVENGEGTIPVESSDIVPTWDGIQHGERLRTMSCSDKILRWNVLGLQGAILTHFMEPVYLNSITLGYLYSQGHLTRAVCCRLSKNGDAFQEGLTPPFTLNHPMVGRVSVYDSTRQTGKTKESSVNWCLADDTSVEILDGTKGKVDGPKLDVSRVSKQNIYQLYQELCRKTSRDDLLSLASYSDVKEAAVDYNTNKEHFVQTLAELGYGNWICKPQEEKSFTVE
ncbi:double-stranded RNA-specific adenosine deaminase isoform X2 [Pleurodeles waltl]|uniref:double-stranded RNA-specific adenosine deaminase isoform X2 n=2 Tax=Pleurodeles waltl TaxID=8319 RepID=UPI003709B7BE